MYEEDKNITAASTRPSQYLVWCFLVVGLFAYMVMLPSIYWLIEMSQPKKTGVIEDLTLVEIFRIKSVELATGVMFFAVGASVGSFLNVVVYRMPRGLSVLFKPSFCPQCSMKILSRDNIPILGWLWLKGACRNCKQPISVRYPTIELITGMIFLLFFFVELISGGSNLPVRIINHYKGVVWILLYPKWDIIGLYIIHMTMFSTLLVWSLVQADQQRVPIYSWITAILFPSIPMLFWPELSLVPSSVFLNWNLLLNLQQPHILFTILSGTLSGFILYGIAYSLSCLSYLTPQYNAIRHESLFFGLTLVGAVLGWQANLAIFALFALGWFTLLLTTNRNRFVVLAPFVLLCATLIHHIFWRFLSTYYLGLTN